MLHIAEQYEALAELAAAKSIWLPAADQV